MREKLVSTIENAFKEKPAEEAELKLQQNEQALMFDRALADPEQFAVGLSDYIALGDWRLFFADREEVASVTVDEVNKAAAKYLVRDNRVVGEYIPTTELKRAEIAPAPSAEEVLKKYDFKAEGKAVAAFDPSQDNLNASTKRVEIDGIKTALLPKASRGETVTVSMQLQNGDFESAKKTAVSMLGAAMLQRGTDEMTRDDIDRAFTENRMEGSPFTFTTDREHVAGAIALAGHLMTRSTFPEKEFETLKSQMIQGLKARSDDPRTKASDAITKHFDTYPKGDPRHTETSEELLAEIEAVTLDQVKDWYKNVFGTTEGNFAVVGDFDEEAVKKALSEKIVGEKTKTVKFERVVREYRPVKADRITIDTPEKENAVLYARVAFPANQKDADRAALLVADHILGGSSGLSNRDRDASASEGRPLLRCRLEHPHSVLRRCGELERSRHRGAAEHRAGRSESQGRTRPRREGRHHRRGTRRREEGHARRPRRQPRPGLGRGPGLDLLPRTRSRLDRIEEG